MADEDRRRASSPTTAGPAPSSAPTSRPRGGLRALPRPPQARPAARAGAAARASGTQLGDLELRDDLFDDFCLAPFHPRELEARLKHLFWRTGRGTRPELIEYGELVLNLETYQAAISGQPLDLTYMEYELLKFLASHPGKVFTRETLLSGSGATSTTAAPARSTSTSDACGPSSARSTPNLIQTVRSVGYRFGQSRWGV